MSRSLRIGLVTPGWPGQNTPNGIATSVYHLALGLRDIGHRPIIIPSLVDGEVPEALSEIPVFEAPDGYRNLFDLLQYKAGRVPEVRRRVQARRYATAVNAAQQNHGLDVVLMEETNGWSGLVAAQVTVPVVTVLHGPWQVLSRVRGKAQSSADQDRIAAEGKAFRSAPALIAPSQSSLDAARETAGTETPCAVIPNPFPAATGPLSAQQGRADILFVGRFEALKGADTVLDAFERLATRVPDVRLTMVGPGSTLILSSGEQITPEEALKRISPVARERLDLRGALAAHEVAALRKTHAVALIASRYENLNYSLLEALSAGQAIVCTKVGGPAEVLTHEETALMVPPGDDVAMAESLERLVADTELRQRLGQSGRDLVTDEFSPTVIARQYAEFLEKVLSD